MALLGPSRPYGGVTTLIQIRKDKCYNLNPQEQKTMVIFRLGQFNPVVHKEELSLQRGFTWAWHPMHSLLHRVAQKDIKKSPDGLDEPGSQALAPPYPSR